MSEHLIGAVLERAPGPRYFESLRFAEIAPRGPLPRPSVLSKWKSAAPEGARFTLLAPAQSWRSESGPFREDPAKAEGAEWIARAHDALGADAIVLATGRDLTPGPADRERLARWAARLGARGRRVVWQPGGVWDVEEAAIFAAKIGVVCAFDPLEGAAPAGDVAYARVRAIGARARLGEGLLSSIVDAIADAPASTVYLAIEADDAIKKARRAAAMLAENEAEGGGAVLRRTGGVAIDLGDEDEDEDDEDEDESDDADEDDADEDADEDDDADDDDEDEDEDADDEDA
jgi:uncharacterized protein YecE (DUF72 family)